jgi:hypothetical protein
MVLGRNVMNFILSSQIFIKICTDIVRISNTEPCFIVPILQSPNGMQYLSPSLIEESVINAWLRTIE